MKVKNLISFLSSLNPEAQVLIFDADSGKHDPVTGATYGGSAGLVILHSDTMNAEDEPILTDADSILRNEAD